MLRSIVLHGRLGEEFGGPYPLDVISPAEAVRALCVMVKGFRASLREGHYRVIRGPLDRGREIGEDTLTMRLGAATELHIVPVVGGGANALGKIIAGIALIAAAFLAPYALPSISFAAGSVAASITGVAVGIGASLALGGVAMMLAPAPQTQNGNASVDQMQSFLFGGLTNVATQGGPVPLVYGRMRVGSVEVSVGVTTEQLGAAGSFGPLPREPGKEWGHYGKTN